MTWKGMGWGRRRVKNLADVRQRERERERENGRGTSYTPVNDSPYGAHTLALCYVHCEKEAAAAAA